MDDRDYYADLEDTLYQRALAEAAAAASSYSGGGGGSSKKTSSGSNTNRYDAVLAQVRLLDAGGSSSNIIQGKINTAYNAGSITEAQKNWLSFMNTTDRELFMVEFCDHIYERCSIYKALALESEIAEKSRELRRKHERNNGSAV